MGTRPCETDCAVTVGVGGLSEVEEKSSGCEIEEGSVYESLKKSGGRDWGSM